VPNTAETICLAILGACDSDSRL